MNFIIDENIDFPIEEKLEQHHFSVYSIQRHEQGLDDEEIIQLANEREAVIITNDTDFSELSFRQKLNHRGVILIRLEGLSNQHI